MYNLIFTDKSGDFVYRSHRRFKCLSDLYDFLSALESEASWDSSTRIINIDATEFYRDLDDISRET